ncbi:GntR family transcriptional regulator [Caproiciproducens galactitolivorans]|uniref:GntR family transcriptional regulator n=1 Tax=Caproiciproducens galactitolivorans TaxID=642589 RepID=A0ABT4BWI9_9FIRM|nr:GntR family transcriptional regulator [Caproiciproducens galactitolivorans]MCY1715257.1 GntR family transcriptional regulator [Caproiciproducens galactitolivorans]
MTIKKNLDIIVYEKIKDSLIGGEYLPGVKISVDELAAKYGVSRTPVIQATKLLAKERILDVKCNGSISVPQYNDKQIRDICTARMLVERFAVMEICDKKDREAVQVLRELALFGSNTYQQGDYLTFCKEDLHFHKAMVSMTGNECLCDVFNTVQGRLLAVMNLALCSQPRLVKSACIEHLELSERLGKFDKAGAVSLVERHIFCLRGRLLELD